MKHTHIAINDGNDNLQCKICHRPLGSIKKWYVDKNTWAWTVIEGPVNDNADINYNRMVPVRFVKLKAMSQN